MPEKAWIEISHIESYRNIFCWNFGRSVNSCSRKPFPDSDHLNEQNERETHNITFELIWLSVSGQSQSELLIKKLLPILLEFGGVQMGYLSYQIQCLLQRDVQMKPKISSWKALFEWACFWPFLSQGKALLFVCRAFGAEDKDCDLFAKRSDISQTNDQNPEKNHIWLKNRLFVQTNLRRQSMKDQALTWGCAVFDQLLRPHSVKMKVATDYWSICRDLLCVFRTYPASQISDM